MSYSFAPAFVLALASSLVVRTSFIVPASVRRPSANLSSLPFYTDPYSAFPCHSSTEHGLTSSHLLSSLSALGVACLTTWGWIASGFHWKVDGQPLAADAKSAGV
ncbi:hypothetical protein B0H13DRAFT_2314865 [Mycena leptocephala]|nr:hypothetical protein B0H13DRAFT_2314865 [Mycena leptocephala]